MGLPGVYAVITVDTREPETVLRYLRNMGVPLRVERLEVADYVVEESGYTVGVERKTADDFVASIIDGRFQTQAYYLSQAYPLSFYVVEGCISEALLNRRFKREAYLSAMVSVALKTSRYGYGSRIGVLNVETGYDTAVILVSIHRFLERGDLERVPGKSRNPDDPVGVMTMMLLNIPGIGESRARLLAEHFQGRISHLLNASDSEILSVRGVGRKTLENIRRYVR